MLSHLRNQFQNLKTAAFNFSVNFITDIARGRMINLSIDSTAKTISVELGPKGEDKPIKIEIERYELLEGSPLQIRFGPVKSDRPMYDIALKSFVSGKAFDLPPVVSEWLKLFL